MSELENLHNEETNDTSYDHVIKYTGVFGGVQGLKMLVSVASSKERAVENRRSVMMVLRVLPNADVVI